MDESKECPTCGEEIKAKAKKCPYCQSWQSKWRYDQSNIKHQLIFIAILLGFFYFFFYSSFGGFFNPEDFSNHRTLLSINDTKLSYSDRSCGPNVTILGTITNNSSIAWEDINFEARFYNDKDELIDTISDQNYDLIVLPGGESTFKVTGSAAMSEESYHHHKIIIKDAREKSSLL